MLGCSLSTWITYVLLDSDPSDTSVLSRPFTIFFQQWTTENTISGAVSQRDTRQSHFQAPGGLMTRYHDPPLFSNPENSLSKIAGIDSALAAR